MCVVVRRYIDFLILLIPTPLVLALFAAAASLLINPRRACAARVTVLGLSVCLSCVFSLFWQYAG